MATPQQLKQAIETALPGARVQVRDLKGTGDHFEAHVMAPQFQGLSPLDRDRLVHRAFGPELDAQLHALSLKTEAPGDNGAENRPEAVAQDSRQATDPLMQRFRREVEANPVMVYIKGTPDFPMCGYSRAAVQCFEELGAPIGHVNVLQDPDAWEGIKRFTNWPTIPQIFIGGKFVGGSGNVVELREAGQLEPLVREALAAKSGA